MSDLSCFDALLTTSLTFLLNCSSTALSAVFQNPYDNVVPMAHHFFKRCLEANITPYVCTKKTVFKWQETFWQTMKNVFDESYKADFVKAGLLKKCGGELTHYLSDVATMNIIRWTDGGWGMAAHNYDGDVLTDELAIMHRSPGFLTSVLNGVNDDGTIIKEFESSHGTVTDMWHAHLKGEETSLNPLSMMEALVGAMIHSATLGKERKTQADNDALIAFSKKLQTAIHEQMTCVDGGTRDLCGAKGLTTAQFVAAVRKRLDAALAKK
jgi:isocitrate dehydrogenase